jgi:hypothetical protein
MNARELQLMTGMAADRHRTRLGLLQWLTSQRQRITTRVGSTPATQDDTDKCGAQPLLTDNQMTILDMVLGGFGRTQR